MKTLNPEVARAELIAAIATRTQLALSENAPRFTAVLAKYSLLWKHETSPDERRELMSEVWEPDGYYCDPSTDPLGPSELSEHIEGTVLPAFPGLSLRRTGELFLHGSFITFNWEYLDSAGEVGVFPGAYGYDIAHLAPSGRLQSVVGFFDALVTSRRSSASAK